MSVRFCVRCGAPIDIVAASMPDIYLHGLLHSILKVHVLDAQAGWCARAGGAE